MDAILQLKTEMQDVLENNILKYWIENVQDSSAGGFHGRIDGNGNLVKNAERSAILNARILWAFSAAYRVLKKEIYLKVAQHAFEYIRKHFIDRENGGVFWSLNADGSVLNDKKQSYAIGFMIYGMSEYVRATGDKSVLEEAIKLYEAIENYAFDARNCGYVEALTRDWKPINDMRLSDKDENASRTMNTHLHIIEPYTNLYRVWKSVRLENRIRVLLDIFTEKIFNGNTHHLDLFFDDEWHGKRNIESYGHDIEASWLLHESALVLGDRALLAQIEPVVKMIAEASTDGIRPDGSMIYEKWTDTGLTDAQRQWWVQCENIVGNMNLYQHFGDEDALCKALKCWEYTKKNIIDWNCGEWFWGVNEDGTVNKTDDKAGFWKCPYHNSRMCLEIIERF